MSYGLRGSNGRLRGLGYSLQDLISAFPGQEDCSPFASDCVARQTQRMSAINAMWVSDPHSGHNTTENWPVPSVSWSPDQSAAAVRQFESNQPVFSGQVSTDGASQSVAQLIAASSPAYRPQIQGGRLSFTSSRGGSSLYVGDTWLISITGASPNSPVTVSGSGPGGPFGSTPMGSTDSSGNFSKSGSVGTGEIGSWVEQWAVGGASSGSILFTVAALSGAKTPGTSAGDGAKIPATGFDFSKIPWWGWAGAAGVALFAFGGGRGR